MTHTATDTCITIVATCVVNHCYNRVYHCCIHVYRCCSHVYHRVSQTEQGGYSLDYALKELSDDELSSSSR